MTSAPVAITIVVATPTIAPAIATGASASSIRRAEQAGRPEPETKNSAA